MLCEHAPWGLARPQLAPRIPRHITRLSSLNLASAAFLRRPVTRAGAIDVCGRRSTRA